MNTEGKHQTFGFWSTSHLDGFFPTVLWSEVVLPACLNFGDVIEPHPHAGFLIIVWNGSLNM